MKSNRLIACMALGLALAGCKTGSQAQQSPLSLRAGDQVAVVDGKPVTYGEVEKEQGGKLAQAEIKAVTELYDVRRNAIEQFVTKRLLEEEAKSKGLTLEQWLDKDLLATYLKQQKGRDQLSKVVDDLKQKHGVQITLAQPNLPRVEVAATGPSRGPENAPVTIVEFSDFQCPYCGREVPVVERVMKEYDGKVRLVFRHFPLEFHPFAQKADQGGEKFWKLHDRMFTNQQKLAVDDLKGYAKEAGLDSGRFDKCLDSGEKRTLVETDTKAGQEAGVNGTPAFFVNGVFINGAVPYEQFKDAVDRELKRKG